MAVNDTIQLSVIGNVFGQAHVHTLHFRMIDASATDQGLIDDWQANVRTAYRNCFTTTQPVIQLIRAAQVCGTLPLRAPAEEAELAATQFGTITPSGDSLPSWLASVHSLRTASAGKSRRGRFFLGGLYENMASGNDLNAGTVTTRTAYSQALLTRYTGGITGSLFRLVVHSRKLASVPGTQCQDSSTLITSILDRVEMGSMKSRKPGSGT